MYRRGLAVGTICGVGDRLAAEGRVDSNVNGLEHRRPHRTPMAAGARVMAQPVLHRS